VQTLETSVVPLPPRLLAAIAIDYARFATFALLADPAPGERTFERVLLARTHDIWLIRWAPGSSTELHDHGGSSGSFTVLSGTLTEAVVAGDRTRDRRRPAGESVGFGPRYVHDVRNLDETPAVSVHAYSPPLTSMTYYDLADGRLAPIRTLATGDPEPGVAARAS